MSNIDKFNFSADRPIHNIDEDLLGRAKFFGKFSGSD